MANMENLKDKANDAAQTAAKAAKYVALASKKRIEILNEKDKIRRNYTRLGKIYYKDFATDEEPDSAEYDPLCESISESFRRINKLREEIAAAKAAYTGAPEEEEPDPAPAGDAETAEPAGNTETAAPAGDAETAEPEE